MRRLLLAAESWPRGGGFALDGGCGDGRISRILAAQGWQVVAIDRQAVPGWSEAPPSVRFETCDLLRFHPCVAFDLVTLFGVLHYLSGPDETRSALSAAVSWLTSGGLMLVSWISDEIAHPDPGAFLPPQALVRNTLGDLGLAPIDYWQTTVEHAHGTSAAHRHHIVYSAWSL